MSLQDIIAKAKGILAGPSSVFGDGDPKKKKQLSYGQIGQWSDYADANPSGSLEELWKGFTAKNPNSGIDYEILKSDLEKLRSNNMRVGERSGSDLTNSLHTGYSFPRMVVDGKDYGRVNADLKTEVSMPSQGDVGKLADFIPSDSPDFWFDPKDGLAKFIDPSTGDIKYAKREALNDPRLKKSSVQQQKDLESRGIVAASSPASIITR